jgi:hypothetical protein
VWENQLGDATYKMGQNSLTITLDSKGQPYDLYPGNNIQAPRLLQSINGNFTVKTTIINLSPSSLQWYQGAGILIWQDENHFLRLERDNTGLLFISVENGHAQNQVQGMATPLPQIELMLQRVDKHFTAYWKVPAPGQLWQEMGNFDNLPLANISVGLDLVNTVGTPIAATYEGFNVSCD